MGSVEDCAATAVILDQHPLWLEALQTLLDRIGVDVVGKTSAAGDAVGLVYERKADIFITELEFFDGETDGLGAVKQVREAHPAARSVVISAYEDAAHVEAAFAAGASAYCSKRAAPDDLAAVVRQVLDRCVYFAGGLPAPVGSGLDGGPRLTRREQEILRLVAEGHSNSQLAQMLWVTEQTVKFHLSNIYRKLDVSNRTEAARWAQVHGLLGGATGAAA